MRDQMQQLRHFCLKTMGVVCGFFAHKNSLTKWMMRLFSIKHLHGDACRIWM
jgi:hypothetical protein